MKSFIMLTYVLLVASCASQKNKDNNAVNEAKDSAITEVVYNAITRGSSKNITVVNNNMFYKTADNSKSYSITSEERGLLNEKVNALDLENISSLKAPSTKHMFDGAMHATITVKKGDKTYTSSTFDDGNPPEALKPLVTLLESFVK